MMQRKEQIEELLENIQAFKRKIFFGIDCNKKNGHITASQWLVLRHLCKGEGSTLKEVALALSITSSAATQLVDALVQKGYIIRKIGADDKRELKLMLSNKTKRRIKELRKNRIQKMGHIFDALNDREFKLYCSLCNKIAESLTAKQK